MCYHIIVDGSNGAFFKRDLNKKAKIQNIKIIYWALFDVGRFHCRKPMPICNGCPLIKYCKNRKKVLEIK